MSQSAQETQKYVLEHKQEAEVSRLQTQHDMIKYNLDGKLLMPEVADDLQNKKGLQVLDSGTAEGTWLRDVARQLPDAEFTGTDLSTTFFPKPGNPVPSSPNIHYALQDVLKPWPEKYQQRFDLTHQRLVFVILQNAADLRTVLRDLAATVKPGGWIQLEEADYSKSHPSSGPAVKKWNEMMRKMLKLEPQDYCKEIAPILRELGFQNVQDRTVELKKGAVLADRDLAERDMGHTWTLTRGFVDAVKGKGIVPDEELEMLPERLQEELENQGGIFYMRVVWGQKPLK